LNIDGWLALSNWELNEAFDRRPERASGYRRALRRPQGGIPVKPTAFGTAMWKAAPPARREIQQSLLLVVLDDLGGTHFGFARVFAELTECAALP